MPREIAVRITPGPQQQRYELELLVKILPSKINNFFLILTYLKVKKVPNNITPQQATIAEKIPVFNNADL